MKNEVDEKVWLYAKSSFLKELLGDKILLIGS